MSIWLDSKSKIVVQGITGKNGQFHSEQMLDYGSKVIGGVTPGKGGQETLGLPIWDTMSEAVDAGANVSCVFVASLVPITASGTTLETSCAKKPSTVLSLFAFQLNLDGLSCFNLVVASQSVETFSLSL